MSSENKPDSNSSHNVVELNGGQYLYSDKGRFYMDRRENPKKGIRKPTPGQEKKYSEGYSKAFGVPVCSVCGVEVEVKSIKVCDECRSKED